MNPIVKWAGGKRQLLPAIHERMPQEYGRYFEPFIGGGALLFDLEPENAVINDINSSLIGVYRVVRDEPQGLMDAVRLLDEKIASAADPKAFYYETRDDFNKHLAADDFGLEASALFVFMNKHCFNGLFRVNAKGLFNVPYNNSIQPSFSQENIFAVSSYLKGVEMLNGDFEVACEKAGRGDFVFFDSPYAPLNPTSFEAYTKEGFAREEHIRLADLYRKLTDRGCLCMLTNHNTEFIQELYQGFNVDVVSVRRSINADASKRTGTEVIIRNY